MELYHNGEWELSLSKETEIYLKELQKEFMPDEYDSPKDWGLKEINNVMNHSISGWEKVSSHRFSKYGTQRG